MDIAQLLWLKENEPALYEKIRYVFFEKDYIRYFLTGVFCTDYIEAQGSMLFDCNSLQWDMELYGSFTGIRATHTKAHFTRAVLEGVAYSLLDCKCYLDSLQVPCNTVATAIGGGMKGKLWLQMVSDVLGIALRTTESSDSSLGFAMLAGISVGVFADAADAVKKCVKQKDIVYPNTENTKAYRKVFSVYKQIHDALAPIYRER